MSRVELNNAAIRIILSDIEESKKLWQIEANLRRHKNKDTVRDAECEVLVRAKLIRIFGEAFDWSDRSDRTDEPDPIFVKVEDEDAPVPYQKGDSLT